ncbi:MAG: hypothetical protein WC310_02010 [Patescibacteria group bacterium]|jgi:hypothetical protein
MKKALVIILFLFFALPASAVDYYGYFSGENFSDHSLEQVKGYTNTYMIDVPTDILAVKRAAGEKMSVIINLSFVFSGDNIDNELQKISERYSEQLKKQVAIVYIYDEPDLQGITSQQLSEMIETAKIYFPYSKSLITYSLSQGLDAEVPSNIDYVGIDPYFYPAYPVPPFTFERCPTYNHLLPVNFSKCYNWYVNPRVEWALNTGKDIFLVAQSHGQLNGYSDEEYQNIRNINVPQPLTSSQNYYVQTAFAHGQIKGFLWFLHGNICYAHAHTKDIVGANNDVRNIVFHNQIGKLFINKTITAITGGNSFIYPAKLMLAKNEPLTYSCGIKKIVVYFKGAVVNPIFSSSDTNVAYVSSNGLVTAMGLGTAIITAKYNGQTFKSVVTVVDPINLTRIQVLDKGKEVDEINLNIGQSKSLEIKHTDQNYNTVQVLPEWDVLNTETAQIDFKGNLTGKSLGTTWLKVKYHIGYKWVKVTVK